MASEVSHRSYSSLHFVLFPFMAQGHMIPMVDIAKLLAQRGVAITIITTPNNAARFKNVLHRAIESGLSINLVHVKFPHQEAGLPEGQENVDFLESMGSMATFLKAVNMLEEPVQKLIDEMTPQPSCIISDMCLFYTNKIAKRLNIPKIVFHGFSSFCLLCMHVLRNNHEMLENIKSDKEYFLLPSFPDKVEFTKLQAPVDTHPEGDWKDVLSNLDEADTTSFGVIVNTFEELEPAYVKELKEARDGDRDDDSLHGVFPRLLSSAPSEDRSKPPRTTTVSVVTGSLSSCPSEDRSNPPWTTILSVLTASPPDWRFSQVSGDRCGGEEVHEERLGILDYRRLRFLVGFVCSFYYDQSRVEDRSSSSCVFEKSLEIGRSQSFSSRLKLLLLSVKQLLLPTGGETMWTIKEKDMAEKERLKKMGFLESLICKKEPLSEYEEELKKKLISEMLGN
ncbi:hypothetical protein F2Q70_00008470 [Brassica cretica]|uniref:Glycosyltransferase N-terminal domain-containing protein n=1 Tax=Brassica cretica TaxID=69181 RepID=A0A8S9M0R2_BRACR|nr:hypothetical protein F2Q70_00008470 [Brassica cretica]